jgi:hypothetical protein
MKTLFPAVSASQNLTTFQQLAKSISTNIYDISASSIPKHTLSIRSEKWKTLFLDLITFLLDLDTFTGPCYIFFADGYPSFGPAHPPSGPHPSLLLDLALSQTIPFSDRFYSFCPAASASQFFRQ